MRKEIEYYYSLLGKGFDFKNEEYNLLNKLNIISKKREWTGDFVYSISKGGFLKVYELFENEKVDEIYALEMLSSGEVSIVFGREAIDYKLKYEVISSYVFIIKEKEGRSSKDNIIRFKHRIKKGITLKRDDFESMLSDRTVSIEKIFEKEGR